MERTTHGELPPFLRWSPEPEALDDLQEWYLPSRLHHLTKSLVRCEDWGG